MTTSKRSFFYAPLVALFVLATTAGVSAAEEPVSAEAEMAGKLLFVSSSASGSVDGVRFADEDLLVFDPAADVWRLAFDGSDVGLARTDIDAVQVESLDPLVMHFSVTRPTRLDGVGRVDDSDILTFVGTPGEFTSGRFGLASAGADTGLSTNSEDINALTTVDGAIAVSTLGRAKTGSATATGSDLFVLSPEPAEFFVGSDVGLRGRNLVAADYDDSTNTLIGSATRNWNLNGIRGTNRDLFSYNLDTGESDLVFTEATERLGRPIDAVDVAIGLEAPRETWAEEIGGSATTFGNTAVDVAGNVFATGRFNGEIELGRGANAVTLVSQGEFDGFLAKYTPGGGLLWAFNIGGLEIDSVFTIAVDPHGNPVVLGVFGGSVDFDPGPGETVRQSTTSLGDPFIATYSTNGELIRLQVIQGEEGARNTATGIAFSPDGSIVVTGSFSGTVNFAEGSDRGRLSASEGGGVFIARYAPSGVFQWARALPSTGLFAGVNGVAVDDRGLISLIGFVVGGSIDVDPGPGERLVTTPEGAFVFGSFIATYDRRGRLMTATDFNGADVTLNAFDVAADRSIVAVGSFSGTVDFDPGPGESILTSAGPADGLILELDALGRFARARSIPGEARVNTFGVVKDDGNTYLSGRFFGPTDLDPGPDEEIVTNVGPNDAYVLKLDSDGELQWVQTFGGEDSATEISNLYVANDGSLVVAGSFTGEVDVDPGPGITIFEVEGNFDFFIAKLDSEGNLS